MHPEPFQTFRQAGILRDHHARVAVPTQVLRWEKAEGSNRRDLSCHAPLTIDLPTSPNGQGRVLDHGNPLRRQHHDLNGCHLTE